MNPGPSAALLDGLAWAERGRWHVAEEAFVEAADEDPEDPRPALGHAICLLARGQNNAAMVLLETDPRLDPGDPLWGGRIRWLQACARLAGGDPLGAEQAAAGLSDAEQRRVRTAALLREGHFAEGVAALLAGRRP